MSESRQRQARRDGRLVHMTITITALPAELANAADREFLDEDGGLPLRCCLRNSRAGEHIALARVSPPGPQGAYAETGPVFLHAGGCSGPATSDYPTDFQARDQVLRTYNQDGTIRGGEVAPAGTDHAAVAARLLADPEVAFIHTRNIVYGCYMLTIGR